MRKTKMKITCGIFLFNNRNEFLIVHPTNHPEDFWSIPKGIKNKNEDDFDAACRELHEETNIKLEDIDVIDKKHLGMFKYNYKNKKLSAFYVETKYDFKDYEIKCESMVRHLKGKDFPEVDDFKWVNIEEAYKLIHITQVPCLQILDRLRKDDNI